MTSKKILVVSGATGKQGGSVIKAILGDPKASQEFRLRGITRDPSKPAGKALTEQGVECVTGDTNDKDSLKHAFHGAHTVFAVTNYWETMSSETELQQGHNIADAAKEEGVQHLILSTLFNIAELTKGKYPNVHHFDSKAKNADYVRQLGIPASFFMPGFYMSNFEDFMRPAPQPPHTLTLALPMPETTPIPCFDAAGDTGKYVKAMALKRDQVLGKEVLAATEYYTVKQVIETIKSVKKIEAQIFEVDEKTYKGYLSQMPEFVQQELYENMHFMNEFGYYGKQSLDWSLSLLDEKPTTFEEFVDKSQKFANQK